MENRLLRSFLAVAKTGTLTSAAHSLNITQPALSRQLKNLETELGVTLFEHSHKPITLTENGIYLVEQAEKILNLVDTTTENIKHEESMNGTLTIGAAESPMVEYILKTISNMQRLYPNLKFNIISGSTSFLLDQLNQGTLDFLFALDFNKKSSYNFIDFPDEDRRGVYLNKNHSLNQQEYISISDLEESPIFLPYQSSFTDDLISSLSISTSKLHVIGHYNLLRNILYYPSLNPSLMIVGINGLSNQEDIIFKPIYPTSSSCGTLIWKQTPFLPKLMEEFLHYLTIELHGLSHMD